MKFGYQPINKTRDLIDSLIGEGQRPELRILRLFKRRLGCQRHGMYKPRSKGLDN
jgi:hypothetical protein